MDGRPYIFFMEIPSEVAVMTLPNVTLFPQAWLPLYIFESRYRRMLKDALESHRMIIVAMQKENHMRESPSHVAGLGLIRIAMQGKDGSSNLILQGLTRVELGEVVRYKPYRLQRIRPLQAPQSDNVTIDALLAKVRDLVNERVQMGLPSAKKIAKKKANPLLPMKEVVKFIEELEDPDQVADLVSCAMLGKPVDRQTILETVDVEPRLKHLIHFLMEEIREERKHKHHE
jgi:Lon protease-like protein